MAGKKILSLKTIIGLIILIVIIAVILIIVFKNQNPNETKPAPLIKVRYASVPAIIEAPAHVAYKKGFFEDEGLDISFTLNPDGKTSLNKMLNGEADIAAVMATPIVYTSFKRDDFYILGKIDHFPKIHWTVARRDRGITRIEDLKGKKIAVMLGTSGQFYMDSWFLYHGISLSEVTIVNLNAPDSLNAIINGTVDAMICWFPFPAEAELALGDNAVTFPPDDLVPNSWVIVAKKEYVHNNEESVKRFLRAIIKAEELIIAEPEETMVLHSEVSGVSESIISRIFNQMQFDLTLDQNIILDMEEQARWIIQSGYTEKTTIPNYLKFIYSSPLKSINSEAVTILTRESDDN